MPKEAITRVSNMDTNFSSLNKNKIFIPPRLTTAQIAAIPAATLVPGAIVFNTDTGNYLMYEAINFAAPTTYSWVVMGTNPMRSYVDDATAAANMPGGVARNGNFYYNTTANTVKFYINAGWETMAVV